MFRILEHTTPIETETIKIIRHEHTMPIETETIKMIRHSENILQLKIKSNIKKLKTHNLNEDNFEDVDVIYQVDLKKNKVFVIYVNEKYFELK